MNPARKKRLFASLLRGIWLAVAALLVVTGLAAGTIGITMFANPPSENSPTGAQNR